MQYDKKSYLKILMFLLISFWMTSNANATTMGATTNDVIGNNLCAIVANLTGNTAKAIGVIAMIILSFGVMTGKINTWTAMSTIIGIFVLFGTSSLVVYLSGQSLAGCTS